MEMVEELLFPGSQITNEAIIPYINRINDEWPPLGETRIFTLPQNVEL